MAKLICFTPRLLTENSVEKQFINTRYLTPLVKRGFNTVMLTADNPNIEDILTLCDGFIITGGTDIDPVHYNETNEGLSKSVSEKLDQIDKDVIEYAVKNKKPLLGICRGHQSINVFLGGSLHQDLNEKNVDHKNIGKNHFIQMKQHPLFAWDKVINVNSYHHQSIKNLAPEFEVIGVHEDSTIEMIVHRRLPIFACPVASRGKL